MAMKIGPSYLVTRGEPRLSGEESRGGAVIGPRPRSEARSLYKDTEGQAVIEYILLLATVVSIYFTVAGWANSYGLAQKLVKPISKDFAAVYQYGDPKASGFDSDTPKRHPRINDCDGCFRLFINPSVK